MCRNILPEGKEENPKTLSLAAAQAGSIFRKSKLALAATAVLYPQTRPSGLKRLLLGQSSLGAATWRKVTLPFPAGRGPALVTSGHCRAVKAQHPAKIWGDSEEVPVESAEDL